VKNNTAGVSVISSYINRLGPALNCIVSQNVLAAVATTNYVVHGLHTACHDMRKIPTIKHERNKNSICRQAGADTREKISQEKLFEYNA
jgi:hypothetical protein